MRLRTQLLLAFIVLAVLPLTAIVLYSYSTSLQAFRDAVEEEASRLAREMGEQMEQAEMDLDERMQRIGQLAQAGRFFQLEEGFLEAEPWVDRVYDELGEVAPFVTSFEVIPSGESFEPEIGHLVVIPSGPPEAPHEPRLPREAIPLAPPAPDPDEIIAQRLEEALLETEKELEALGEEMAEGELNAGLATALGVATEMAMSASAAALQVAAQELERTEVRRVTREGMREAARMRQHFLGRELDTEVQFEGQSLGTLRAEIDPEMLLGAVLGRTRRDQGEIPFATDVNGLLYVADPSDRALLADLPLEGNPEPENVQVDNWILGTQRDPETGLVFGIARPVGPSLEKIRRTAVRNLGWGLALIGLAVLGILPLSTRMSSSLVELTAGAESLASGNLDVKVPVRSSNEVGQLAQAFNRMARDLQKHQVQLLAQERLRREEETDRRLLEAENDRKTRELEDARRFQLSLLPRELPEHPGLDLAVHMSTATEVGGDYYDFRAGEDGELTVAVGDATGHGARAGTMVTVIKSLFSAGAGLGDPSSFLAEANSTIRRMELGRMAMALQLARIRDGSVQLAAAGMPPMLVFRRDEGRIEEVAMAATPLGSFADTSYQKVEVPLRTGDTVLLMSDGLPELLDDAGEPLGYDGVREAFRSSVGKTAEATLAGLARVVTERTGGTAPSDDVTLVAVRVTA